jgi:ABC-type polysaccharide/polyol phosphate export permease
MADGAQSGIDKATIGSADGLTSRARPQGSFAGRDIYDGLLDWRLWSVLGWNDIRRRYRRSYLGPFWITISMSLLVAALGFLYSHIFDTDIETYLPYLALGFILWAFISTCVKESCPIFAVHGNLIKQIRIPFSVHLLRSIWANFIVLLHTIIIIIPIDLYFGHWPGSVALLAVPGILLIGLNLLWIGICLAVLNTRFRDVGQMVDTVLQIAVFATPIMWPVSALRERGYIADVNPIYHLIELVRAPLMGGAPATLSWIVALVGAAAGLLLAAMLLRRTERHIVYWL